MSCFDLEAKGCPREEKFLKLLLLSLPYRFQVKKKQFFRNFGGIMLYGVLGVFISVAVIAVGTLAHLHLNPCVPCEELYCAPLEAQASSFPALPGSCPYSEREREGLCGGPSAVLALCRLLDLVPCTGPP